MNTGKPVIAVIDDDAIIVKLLCQVLGESEFDVVVINESDDIPAEVESKQVDLVLLDLNLKNHYGFEIARQLRSKEELGLIMLTGSNDQIDKVVGLELGLDDYIAKPFDNRELKARCRNVLRRIAILKESENKTEQRPNLVNAETKVYLNRLLLDKIHFKLIAEDGRKEKLTAYEFRLLEILPLPPSAVRDICWSSNLILVFRTSILLKLYFF